MTSIEYIKNHLSELQRKFPEVSTCYKLHEGDHMIEKKYDNISNDKNKCKELFEDVLQFHFGWDELHPESCIMYIDNETKFSDWESAEILFEHKYDK